MAKGKKAMDAPSAIEPLKSGDLVLFAGSRGWLGRLPWRRGGDWTHVGLVLRRADDPEPLLWEARDGLRHGAALGPLAARLARFPGRVAARCLSRPLGRAQYERLEALRQDLARQRTHGLLDLIAAAEEGWLGARPEHLGEPTDAELVATVYQELGLLAAAGSGGRPANRFRPRDFAGAIRLDGGYALGAEIVLHEPADARGWSDLRPQPA